MTTPAQVDRRPDNQRPTAAHRTWSAVTSRPLLALVLLGQAVACLRLRATPFQDEALYLATGHWLLQDWAGGPPLTTDPERWFTGAPQLYPVVAALLDGVGGTALVRALSTAALLLTTVAVALVAGAVVRAAATDATTGATTAEARRAGVVAAVVVTATGPALALGHLATFDTLSFACLAWGLLLALRAAGAAERPARRTWWRGAVVAGGLMGLATLLKYTSGLGVACALAVVVASTLSRPRAERWHGARAAATSAATGAAVLLVSVLTWGRGLVAGFLESTLQRQPLMPEPAGALVARVVSDAGLPLALAVAGAVVLAVRRPLLAVALTAGTLAAVTSQVVVGESVSLYKASALGVVFGAPLAGYLVVRLARHWWGTTAGATALVVAVVLGLGSASRLHGSWPDTSTLVAAVAPLVQERPGALVVADTPEVLEAPLARSTTSDQWAGTYEGAFTYDGSTGVPAFRAAISDGAVGVVVLDGSSAVGRELEPLLPSLGLEQRPDVTSPDGTHRWTVWTRP